MHFEFAGSHSAHLVLGKVRVDSKNNDDEGAEAAATAFGGMKQLPPGAAVCQTGRAAQQLPADVAGVQEPPAAEAGEVISESCDNEQHVRGFASTVHGEPKRGRTPHFWRRKR